MFFTVARRVSAAVVVNEIFPKSADVTTTWIELYNTGPETISLDRWRLENNSSGTYILNASAIISPNAFLTLYQPQTGLTFSIEGDAVRFFDHKNNLIDSQSYPGTLGYNTSIGRSTDGGAGWMTCAPSPDYVATPNKPNKCPPPASPTATPTSAPTVTPTPSNTPSATPISAFIPNTPTTTIDPSSLFAFPDVLGSVISPTAMATPTPVLADGDIYKKVWTISLITGIGLGVIIMSIGLLKTFKSGRIDSDA